MAIVREKEMGTLEQLNVTPLARWELITGKLLPYALIGIIDVVMVLVVALLLVSGADARQPGAAVRDEPGLPADDARPRAVHVDHLRTQQQAMMTTTFFFLTPMIYLSGFIFPIENMPWWIQPITYLIPLRYFVIILRGMFLKGVGLETFWPQALALAVVGSSDPRSRDTSVQQAAGVSRARTVTGQRHGTGRRYRHPRLACLGGRAISLPPAGDPLGARSASDRRRAL